MRQPYKPFAVIFMFFPLLMCCQEVSKNGEISSKEVRVFSEKYSKNAINYFYEVIFFDEIERKNIHLSKWVRDIKYYVTGNPSKGDVEVVLRVIDKLNDLKLPIAFHLVEKKDSSNVTIHFGDTTSLKSLGWIGASEGTAIRTSLNGIIDSGKIFVLNTTTGLDRESVILEEMTQIIGSITDSYSYPESLFYQGFNSVTDYQAIDIEVIRLLYDSLIPFNYCIEDYERDFGDVINYYRTSDKLKRILTKKDIKKSTLETIKRTCYFEQGFYKHPKEIPVYLEGFNHADSVLVLKSLKFFNGLSDNLSIKLGGNFKEIPSTGITIKLLVNDSQDYPTETRIENVRGEVLKPKRIESIAEISYRSSVELKKKRSVILKAIYKCLGPTEMHFEDDWFTYDEEKVVIHQKYADIIRIIYSDEFVDGYPLKEFEELIESF